MSSWIENVNSDFSWKMKLSPWMLIRFWKVKVSWGQLCDDISVTNLTIYAFQYFTLHTYICMHVFFMRSFYNHVYMETLFYRIFPHRYTNYKQLEQMQVEILKYLSCYCFSFDYTLIMFFTFILVSVYEHKSNKIWKTY